MRRAVILYVMFDEPVKWLLKKNLTDESLAELVQLNDFVLGSAYDSDDDITEEEFATLEERLYEMLYDSETSDWLPSVATSDIEEIKQYQAVDEICDGAKLITVYESP